MSDLIYNSVHFDYDCVVHTVAALKYPVVGDFTEPIVVDDSVMGKVFDFDWSKIIVLAIVDAFKNTIRAV